MIYEISKGGGIFTPVPATTVYDVTYNPLQKSAERNGLGTTIRETLPSKWSIQNEWEFGTTAEFYAWFNFLKSLDRIDFTVRFPAPTGNIETAVFYLAPISAKMLNYSKGTAGWWKTLKCNFVEV